MTAVARRALQLRLTAVVDALGPATKHAEEDSEHVHQLRVATRRAAAAVETFGDLLPKRRVKWIAKRLRHSRRAAGAARDLDVFAVRLAGLLAQDKQVDGAPLLKRIRRERRKAQVPICEVYHELRRDKFERRCEKLVRRVRRRDAAGREPLAASAQNGPPTPGEPSPTFAVSARVRLRPIIDAVFDLTHVAEQPVEAWHQLRIETKRLRYAMELFAGAFEAGFRHDVYPQVEALQEQLGMINDHASASARFAAWQDEVSSLETAAWLNRQRTREDAACAECQRQFLRDWPASRLAELKRALERHASLAAQAEPASDVVPQADAQAAPDLRVTPAAATEPRKAPPRADAG